MYYVHCSGVSSCGPKDPTLTDSNQTILVTWKDEPSCSAVHDMLIYELVVLIADEQVHYVRVDHCKVADFLALKCITGTAIQTYL